MKNMSRDLPCLFPDCPAEVISRGYCKRHYGQKRSGHPLTPIGYRKGRGVCSFDGCQRPTCAHGWCTGHYQQFMQKRPMKPLRQDVADANPGICELEFCSNKTVSSIQTLCDRHRRMQKNGEPLTPLRQPKTYKMEPIVHNASGYLSIYVPRKHGRGRQVMYHRWVMEQHLGRELDKGENVHHVNGDRTDNRIENLELWSKAQPAGQRVVDKLKWAREIIDRYQDEADSGLL